MSPSAEGLELPFPLRALNPNSRPSGGRVTKAKWVKLYRNECGWAAKAFWGSRKPLRPSAEGPVRITVTFVVADKRRRDLDNLVAAFKPGQDGIVDAGILSGDHYEGLAVTYTVERGEKACVRVEFASPSPEGWKPESHAGCLSQSSPSVLLRKERRRRERASFRGRIRGKDG